VLECIDSVDSRWCTLVDRDVARLVSTPRSQITTPRNPKKCKVNITSHYGIYFDSNMVTQRGVRLPNSLQLVTLHNCLNQRITPVRM